MTKKVYVIIVSYNGMKWIEECLLSVFQSSIPVHVIVIDNHSTDGTVAFIKQNFPEVQLVEQEINLGFGKANNIGLEKALNGGADYVFLLNQDAFLYQDTLEKLMNVAVENPDYGIISPIQLEKTGTKLEHYFLKFMSRDKTGQFFSDFVLETTKKSIYQIPFIQAAAWLIPKNTLERIGGFDPIFFHYGEDDNYCQRVNHHQLKVGVASGTFIRHDSEKSVPQVIEPFSEKYFAICRKKWFVRLGNLNEEFTNDQIKMERKRIMKSVVACLLLGKFRAANGFIKELAVFNHSIPLIERSRMLNSTQRPNYLNGTSS